MRKQVWSSEAIHVNDDTCVDIKASAKAVVLGQVGKAWFHDLHISPELAKRIAKALVTGASECLKARNGESQ